MVRGLVLAAVLVLAPPAEAAGPFGKIVVGNWTGGAYTNDATGAFSHCAVNAPYRNGTRMFTSITADLKWLIGFAHPAWKLKPGSRLNLQLVFDRTSRIDVTAEAKTPTLLAIAMPAESQLIGAFRQGRILELVANDQRLTFASPRPARCCRRWSNAPSRARACAGRSILPHPPLPPRHRGGAAGQGREAGRAGKDAGSHPRPHAGLHRPRGRPHARHRREGGGGGQGGDDLLQGRCRRARSGDHRDPGA